MVSAQSTANRQQAPRVFPRRLLHREGPPRTFTGAALQQVAFPLGGIGTGTVSLGGRGNLRDWEIFNRPAKGKQLPYTFFAIWAQAGGDAPLARVLERRLLPPYAEGSGIPPSRLGGLPRLRE
ncbi:MAG: GH116 family glycosyl-hydrolase, partial [Chloroflexota bacterium]